MYDAFIPRDMDGDGDVDFVTTRGNSRSFDGVQWLEQVRTPGRVPSVSIGSGVGKRTFADALGGPRRDPASSLGRDSRVPDGAGYGILGPSTR